MIPVDLGRCQADKPNGESFMTLGGGHKMIRCKNKPTVVIKETKPGPDGLYGGMSLCDECLKKAYEQLPEGYFEVTRLPLIRFKCTGCGKEYDYVMGENCPNCGNDEV